ncbi:hypothetical protein CEW46_21515 [Bacillus cereus]|nr:hypothetical protein CEW46_21515 [Bacillus cereus]
MDNGEDIGGLMADRDMWIEEMERISGIKQDRKNRVKKLAGKYVVMTDGKSSGRQVFFQDRNISNKGYWTQFLSNALGFSTEGEARTIANGFKYNNPRVAIVTSEGIYKPIR